MPMGNLVRLAVKSKTVLRRAGIFIPTSEYMKHHIFELRRKIWTYDWSSQLNSCEIKAWKKSGLLGIRIHDCDTVAVLYQLSYQAIWELVILWVRNIPVNNTSEYLKDCIFELWLKIWSTQLGFLPVPGSRSVRTIRKKAGAGRTGRAGSGWKKKEEGALSYFFHQIPLVPRTLLRSTPLTESLEQATWFRIPGSGLKSGFNFTTT